MQASKASDIKITWGALDELSAKTKAEGIQADGAALINGAACTKSQLYKLWDSLYPNITEEDQEEV